MDAMRNSLRSKDLTNPFLSKKVGEFSFLNHQKIPHIAASWTVLTIQNGKISKPREESIDDGFATRYRTSKMELNPSRYSIL